MTTSHNTCTNPLQAAADWFVHLNSGEADSRDWQHFHDWLACDPANEQAWQRIEKLQNRFSRIPGDISKAVLEHQGADSKTGKLLSIVLIAGFILSFMAAFAFSSPYSSADHHTVKGETRTIELADGTELTLNTDTNVAVDYGLFRRTIHLRTGEILVDTAADTALFKRDLAVETAHGRITALGTRFQVRLLEDSARVSVFAGRVAITPAHGSGEQRILDTGHSSEFDKQHVATASQVSRDTLAWTRGMFIADDMRLCSFIAELERYHDTSFYCPTRLGELRISGAFPLDDPERILDAIALSLPVEVQRAANGTIRLRPRS